MEDVKYLLNNCGGIVSVLQVKMSVFCIFKKDQEEYLAHVNGSGEHLTCSLDSPRRKALGPEPAYQHRGRWYAAPAYSCKLVHRWIDAMLVGACALIYVLTAFACCPMRC